VIEERLVDFNSNDHAPMEFKIFVIWGRVWMGLMNYWTEQEVWPGADTFGIVYRNGSMAAGGEYDTFPFKGVVDWEHLVDVAEKLSAHKDMFRVDILVGVPAGTGSDIDERLAAMVYAVSECEIYPTNRIEKWDGLDEEGARLWIAGYKTGNYITIPNDEVAEEFLNTGRLSGVPQRQHG
jgi:hypothetical protein